MGRLAASASSAAPVGALAVALPGATDLQQTLPLIWVLTIISAIGAAITWAVLAYALWRFRDPATRGRKYG